MSGIFSSMFAKKTCLRVPPSPAFPRYHVQIHMQKQMKYVIQMTQINKTVISDQLVKSYTEITQIRGTPKT